MQAAGVALAYDDLFRPTNPPLPLLRVLVAMLAPIGRPLGYEARYEEYSGPQQQQGIPGNPQTLGTSRPLLSNSWT